MRRPGGHRDHPFIIGLVALLLAQALVGCSVVEDVLDPVHARQVAALGGDPSGQRNGPTHRPGQPCLVCHGGLGPGGPDLSVGGTIYESMADTLLRPLPASRQLPGCKMSGPWRKRKKRGSTKSFC